MATARRRLSPEDRRAELLALGAEVFGKRPYDEVRIDEIAERAGVSRALMYHYFPDKRAFFAAVVKDEADRLYAATKTPATGRLTFFEEIRTGVLAYMAYHQQNPEAAWAAYVGLGRSDPVLLGIDDEAKNRQMDHIMTRIGEFVTAMPGHRRAGAGCRTRPAGDHLRLDRLHLRDLPSADHGPHDRRRTARRRLCAHAAGLDRPGARDSRRTGQGGDVRPRGMRRNTRPTDHSSVPVGTMVGMSTPRYS